MKKQCIAVGIDREETYQKAVKLGVDALEGPYVAEKLTTQNMGSVLEQLREELRRFLKQYAVLEPEKLCDRRYERFRKL